MISVVVSIVGVKEESLENIKISSSNISEYIA